MTARSTAGTEDEKMGHRRNASILLLCLILAGSAEASFFPPQAESLSKLREASISEVRVQYRDGFPVSVLMQVPVAGSTPLDRARTFLADYKAFYLQDHPDVDLVYSRGDYSDEDGEVVRFAQTFRGLRVFEAEIAVQMSPDTQAPPQRVFRTLGRLLIPARTSSATPIEPTIDWTVDITEGQAEDAALAYHGNDAASVLGQTLLMLYDPSFFDRPGNPRLVYRVGVMDGVPYQFLVDAKDSSVVYEEALEEMSAGLSDFDMLMWDSELSTMQDENCFFYFSDNGILIGDEGGLYLGASVTDPEAVAAWNAARDTYLMFHDRFGMHSYDDDDAEVTVAVHSFFAAGPNAKAGAWCGIEFSNGMVTDDVMAHEWGHLVIDESSDLVGSGQPGSLNEAYADIMGMLLDTGDWQIGEGVTAMASPIRDLQNPPSRNCPAPGAPTPPATTNSAPCPDRASNYFVLPGSVDNGGVHINAGIINKAFYLIAAGGTFNGRTVNGMGRTKMGRVAQRTFTNLPAIATFIMARDAAVAQTIYLSLMNLAGMTAGDVCTVKNAFAAVELGVGDVDCDGVDDNTTDSDGDGILDDGDFSGIVGDSPCTNGATSQCDDNCKTDPNPGQANWDNDPTGDICDADDDQDGIPDAIDPCPNQWGRTGDTDGDTIPDCLDPDDDDDGVPDDGDSSGDPYDNPCQGGATTSCDDNCRGDVNPSQFDGNSNGFGDACDPDHDGDGLYGLEDNCTFVFNPGQEDMDSDGIGDACDKCPNTDEDVTAYTYPVNGEDPMPYQPDSDHDGVPDACDTDGFGSWGLLNDGDPYGGLNVVDPDGALHTLTMTGPAGAGGRVALPFSACNTGAPNGVSANERVEIQVGAFPPSIHGWLEDERGRRLRRLTPDATASAHGLRFRPRCHRRYSLVFETDETFDGEESFSITASAYLPSGDNPWGSNPAVFADVPPPPPDQDGDGIPDAADTCPAVHDPTNADSDHDGLGNVCDSASGGPITLTFSGVVTTFDAGGGPELPGIEPGLPFTGTLTYDTAMSIAAENRPSMRAYVAYPPLSPLGLSVTVAGHSFSAGPGSNLELRVEDGTPTGGEDRFIVVTTDIAEYAVPSESMALILRDSTALAAPGLAIPDVQTLAAFGERRIEIDLDPAGSATPNLVLQINDIDSAYAPGRLYWLDSATHGIMRSDLDGSNVTTIVTASDPVGFEVDVAGNHIYWTECCPGKVVRSDLDGGNVTDLASGLGFPFGIGLDSGTGMLAFAENAFPSEIGEVSISGGVPGQLVALPAGNAYGLTVDPAGGKVYWTQFGAPSLIRRANLDGSAVEDLVDSTTDPLGQSRAVALDAAAGKMYWTDNHRDEIRRADLDGTNQELLVDVVSAGLADPSGIALDSNAGKIYWGDNTNRRIQRANLDGTQVETVLDDTDGVVFPRDVFVDPGTACMPPTERLSIDAVAKLVGGNPEFTAADPNQPVQVSGYNVYRSADPGLSKSNWPLVALNAPDAIQLNQGVQWADGSGDASPTRVWYYSIVAYNATCPLEGPQ